MDFHFIFLLGLTIWGNQGLEQATACSVLPGGFPKCFQVEEDSSSDHEKRVREIDYRIHGQNMMYGYKVNPDRADDVRLGEQWQERIGHEQDVVLFQYVKFSIRPLRSTGYLLIENTENAKPEECERDLTEDKPEYETKMYDYRKEKTVPFNVIGEAPVTTLFVITNKEVWHCTVKEQRPGYGSYQFTRVVTELVSKEIIGQLYFFDGTEVITIPIPGTGEQKPNTAVVKEIKYLHPESNAVLKYSGYLEFFEAEDSPHQGVFERLGRERVPGEGEVEDYQRDVFYRTEVPESFLINHHNPEDGHIFTDDQKPYGDFGEVEDRATCEILTEDKRLYDLVMLPYWNIWAKPGKYYEPQLISQADFTNHFVVTKHEIWQCNIEDKGKFLRSVMEYIGKTPMRTIEFYDDNTVWKFSLNDHQSRSAAVRAIHYHKENDLRVTYRYHGLVKLMQRKQGFVRRIVDAYGNFLATKSGKFIVETGKI